MGPTIYRAGRWGATEAGYGPVASPRRLCYASAIRQQLPESAKPAPPASAKQRGTGLISRWRDKDIIANRSHPVKGVVGRRAAISLARCYMILVAAAAPPKEQP